MFGVVERVRDQAIVRYLKHPSIIVVGKQILILGRGSRQLSDELG